MVDNHKDNESHLGKQQDSASILDIIKGYTDIGRLNWKLESVIAILAIFLAVAGTTLSMFMPKEQRIYAFTLTVVALTAVLAFILLFKKLTIKSDDPTNLAKSQDIPRQTPDLELERLKGGQTLITSHLPLNLELIASETGRGIANKINGYCDGSPKNRFFVEMLFHRLHLFNATPDGTGYTVIRNIEDLSPDIDVQERKRHLRETVMRMDYAAIFNVAIASARAEKDKRPQFDTVIFRDSELWLDPIYWRENEILSQKTKMRRLLFYEKDMFDLAENGRLKPGHRLELSGLFIGIRKHRENSWKYRVINYSGLAEKFQKNLFGPDFDSSEIQSSAAFGQHTVVFIKLTDDGHTLVHRFYSDKPDNPVGKVSLFSNSFNQVFNMNHEVTEEILKENLKKEYPNMKNEIESVFQEAMKLAEAG